MGTKVCGHQQSLLYVSRWRLLFCIINAHLLALVANADNIRLEDYHLRKSDTYSKVYVQVLKTGGEEGELAEDIDGNKYDLSKLKPYVGLFSSKYYRVSSDNTRIRDSRSGESFTVPIFRATYDDGTVLLAEKDDNGNIVYLELRKPQGEPDMFLVPAAEEQQTNDEYASTNDKESEFLSFTEDDVDYDLLRSQFHYAEESIPEGRDYPKRFLRSSTKTTNLDYMAPNAEYRQGRSSFTAVSLRMGCSSYVVVSIAIVFDADFCEIYGGFEATRRRIMTIVASASFHYERDMCVKLDLTDIHSPESRCRSSRSYPSFFQGYYRDIPCGSDNSFLSLFSDWVSRGRGALRIDADTTVHMFTGYPPPSGTIGCAYVGAFCSSNYAYGIEYMSFSGNPHSQGVVLAHEVGHGLNAPHLKASSNYRHVMEPNINNAADGFSQDSINKILSFLNSDSVTCDGSTDNTFHQKTAPTDSTVYQNTVPTLKPTARPTPEPTSNSGCSVDQDPFQTPTCLFTSNDEGQYACYEISSLLNARTSSRCPFSTARTRILRCDGRLRTGQIPDFWGDGNQVEPPDVFETRSCRAASCVVVSNFVCFRASSKERTYSILYDAYADFDVSRRFSTNVIVARDNGSNVCDVATTRCLDE